MPALRGASPTQGQIHFKAGHKMIGPSHSRRSLVSISLSVYAFNILVHFTLDLVKRDLRSGQVASCCLARPLQ